MIRKSIFFIVAIICTITVVSDSFGKPSLRPVDECFDDDGRSIACDDFPSPLTEYYRIYYRCNGAYPLDGLISSNDLTYGDSYTLQSTSVCSKGGYNVSSSWTCSPSISQPSGTWNKYTDVTCDVTYTPKTYTLIYKCGEGTGSDETNNMTYDTTNYSLKSGAGNCSKTNATFDGWTCKNSSGSEVSLSTSTTKWNIASNVTCTAKWKEIPKINLEFYEDENEKKLVTTGQCIVDGTIGTLPEAPRKPGYRFTGWKTCATVIKSLNVGTQGNTAYGYNWNGTCSKQNIGYSFTSYSCSETPDLSGGGEWKTEFNYGTIWGEAHCDAQAGTKPNKTDAKYSKDGTWNGNEKNCWCRVTGFTANPNPGQTYDYKNGPHCKVVSSAWVFIYADSSMANCKDSCPKFCASDALNNWDGARRGLFDAVGG